MWATVSFGPFINPDRPSRNALRHARRADGGLRVRSFAARSVADSALESAGEDAWVVSCTDVDLHNGSRMPTPHKMLKASTLEIRNGGASARHSD